MEDIMTDENNDMLLPEGFTCSQCWLSKKCVAFGIIQENSKNTSCDFAPSKFHVSTAYAKQQQEEIDRLNKLTQWIPVSTLPEYTKETSPDFWCSEWVLVDWHYDNYDSDSDEMNKEWEETEKACLMKDRERVFWINYQGYEVDLGEPNAPTIWMTLPQILK
jgi:hypothetical protein